MGDTLKNLWQSIMNKMPQAIQPQNTSSDIMRAVGQGLMPKDQFQQNPQQLQDAVTKQMAYQQGLQHGHAAAQQAKKTPTPAPKTPQAQIDPSQPIHDIFHGLISNLQN